MGQVQQMWMKITWIDFAQATKVSTARNWWECVSGHQTLYTITLLTCKKSKFKTTHLKKKPLKWLKAFYTLMDTYVGHSLVTRLDGCQSKHQFTSTEKSVLNSFFSVNQRETIQQFLTVKKKTKAKVIFANLIWQDFIRNKACVLYAIQIQNLRNVACFVENCKGHSGFDKIFDSQSSCN